MSTPKRRREQSSHLLYVGADERRRWADVMPQVPGRADGSVVSQLVKEKLA